MTTRASIDASVVVKWLLPDSASEGDTHTALVLLDVIASGVVEPLQPPHWLAEVAGVMARLAPDRAPEIVQLLHAMELPVLAEPELYVEACTLATRLGHHVFDTLYHAVARCDPNAVCITADAVYHGKARALGGVVLLRDFEVR